MSGQEPKGLKGKFGGDSDSDSDMAVGNEEGFSGKITGEQMEIMEEEEEGDADDGCDDAPEDDNDEEDDDSEEEEEEEDDDDDDDGEEEDDECRGARSPMVYYPGDTVPDGHELVCDESAYVMMHEFQTRSPCLSFDIVLDHLGNNRRTFPHTVYLVAGTQSDKRHSNGVVMLKLYDLEKTLQSADDDENDSEDDSSSEQPKLASVIIPHPGAVNRIRSTRTSDKALAATWSEHGQVHIWDVTKALAALDVKQHMDDFMKTRKRQVPLFTFSGHACEGFGLDWNPTTQGVLASGDCAHSIHVWMPSEDGKWNVSESYGTHSKSVEDIQWSPKEPTIFASCSVDKSICLWDCRQAHANACVSKISEAHSEDVNVISWNKEEPFIVSGGDDHIVNVWDLRKLKNTHSDPHPIAHFDHHYGAITSLEWHHTDYPVFASSGSDDQLVLWDISVEEDGATSDDRVPPQVLFIHQGQKEMKELHWHPQIPGMILSTSLTGFNVFKTISV